MKNIVNNTIVAIDKIKNSLYNLIVTKKYR